MYYCKDCQELMTEEEIESRDTGFYTEFWGSTVYCPSSQDVCPYCGSTNIEEAPRCLRCGDSFVPLNNEDEYCEVCKSYVEEEEV